MVFQKSIRLKRFYLGLFPELEKKLENAARKDCSISNIEKSTKNSGAMKFKKKIN